MRKKIVSHMMHQERKKKPSNDEVRKKMNSSLRKAAWKLAINGETTVCI